MSAHDDLALIRSTLARRFDSRGQYALRRSQEEDALAALARVAARLDTLARERDEALRLLADSDAQRIISAMGNGPESALAAGSTERRSVWDGITHDQAFQSGYESGLLAAHEPAHRGSCRIHYAEGVCTCGAR